MLAIRLPAHKVVATACGALVAGAAFAVDGTLTRLGERTSDEVLVLDERRFEAQQSRLQALNAKGHPLRGYALAKAQCWIDTSWHEYWRNDPSAFPARALAQAARWLDTIERDLPPPVDDDLLPRAFAVRSKLEARLRALRTLDQSTCPAVAAPLACAEVGVIHAAHEESQQGWRHASPYLAVAEERAALAETAAQECRAGR